MPAAVEKQSIAVVGAGLMGHGIAQIFAVHGHPVFLMDLEDTVLSSALESIRANLALMAQRGIGSEAEIEPAIHYHNIAPAIRQKSIRRCRGGCWNGKCPGRGTGGTGRESPGPDRAAWSGQE